MKAEAETATKSGDVKSASIKCSEILSLIGTRKLEFVNLQEIKTWAEQTTATLDEKLKAVEAQARRERESAARAESERIAKEKQQAKEAQERESLARAESERIAKEKQQAKEAKEREAVADAEIAKDEDIEVKGTFTHQMETKMIGDIALTPIAKSYLVEGTIANTGEKNAPMVELSVQLVGTVLIKGSDRKSDPNFIVAEGKDKFKNLRPGQSRTFKLIIDRSQRDERTLDGWVFSDFKASNVVFKAKVQK